MSVGRKDFNDTTTFLDSLVKTCYQFLIYHLTKRRNFPRFFMIHSLLPTFVVASVLCSVALLAPTAEAHQVVLNPMPHYKTSNRSTQYNPIAFLENQGYETQEDFKGWLAKTMTPTTTLRQFMDDEHRYKVVNGSHFHCGHTNPNGSARPIPNGVMRTSGYTHNGMCETWLDDVLVHRGDDCHNEVPGKEVPIDYSSCKPNCMLRWYWMAVRFIKEGYSWQAYKACVPLSKHAKPPPKSAKGHGGMNGK